MVVRCVLLPAVLELLGSTTWRLPRWLDARLPHINIEGSTARAGRPIKPTDLGDASEPEPAPTKL
jgi:RND superfamily putative drug exporter